MQKIIQIGAAVIVVVVVLLISYQSFVVIPQNQINQAAAQAELKIEAEKEAAAERKADYDTCIDSAYDAYSRGWESQCSIAGLKPECILKKHQYSFVEEKHETDQQICLVIFNSK